MAVGPCHVPCPCRPGPRSKALSATAGSCPGPRSCALCPVPSTLAGDLALALAPHTPEGKPCRARVSLRLPFCPVSLFWRLLGDRLSLSTIRAPFLRPEAWAGQVGLQRTVPFPGLVSPSHPSWGHRAWAAWGLTEANCSLWATGPEVSGKHLRAARTAGCVDSTSLQPPGPVDGTCLADGAGVAAVSLEGVRPHTGTRGWLRALIRWPAVGASDGQGSHGSFSDI